MANSDLEMPGADHVAAVRKAFAAALNGNLDAVGALLADDARWYGAGGDPSGGCTSRQEAMVWLGRTLARGVRAEVLDARALDENRVLVRLQRQPEREGEPDVPPHAQIVTFRGDQVAEIVVYPSDAEALAATRSR